MARLLAANGYEVSIIEWDRSGLKPRIDVLNNITFKRLRLKASYGIRILYLIPVWIVYSFLQILLGKYDLVQPQNLDCLIPSFLAKFFRRIYIIYDLADFYADAYVLGFPVVSSICSILERILIKQVDAAILVSERQILQVKARNLPRKVILFYNTPDTDDFMMNNDGNHIKIENNDSLLTLLYAGILSYDRVKLLTNVIKAVEGLPVKIIVAGFGEYEVSMLRMSTTNKQLVFLGRLNHKEVMRLMEKADIALLPYDPSYFNYRIALPNKFFEAIACGCLILAPRGTYIGEITEKAAIGIIVNYNDVKEIRDKIMLLMGIKKCIISILKENAKKLYKERFEPNKTETKYLELVKNLISNKLVMVGIGGSATCNSMYQY